MLHTIPEFNNTTTVENIKATANLVK